jgi:O-methyltransferase involved in polyketide biosynthesis
VQFTGEKATLLATLYGRALDAQSPEPILGDRTALDTVRRMDYDFGTVGLKPGDDAGIALRARCLDDWTREFLAAHPDTTVLHLGCGLDTRVDRLDPGPGVRWFDVDYPEVIALREQLYPARAGYQMIGTPVTEPSWLEQVPAELPVMVVAEGLLYYLREEDGKALIKRIVDRFPSGQFAFDAVSKLGARLQKYGNRAVRAAGATIHWGIDSSAEIEAIDPRLRTLTVVSAFDLDGGKRLPTSFRLTSKVAKVFPPMKNMAAFYRLEF